MSDTSRTSRTSKRCHSHDKVIASVGSRCQVWNGNAEKTSGGLRIGDLFRGDTRSVSQRVMCPKAIAITVTV